MILRELVDAYQQTQKLRIAMASRIDALERETDHARGKDKHRLEQWQNRFQTIEDEIVEAFEEELELHPAWPWLGKVKGVSYILGAKLLGLTGDISKSPTISSLWRFAGMGLGQYYVDGEGKVICPTEGWQWIVKSNGQKEKVWITAKQPADAQIEWRRDRPIKGWCLPYNKRLKTACHLVATSMLRAQSPYTAIYYEAKNRYSQKRLDWTPKQRDYAGRRKMIKVFLSHLWLKWREAVGLPISKPYIVEESGCHHYYKPKDFVPEP